MCAGWSLSNRILGFLCFKSLAGNIPVVECSVVLRLISILQRRDSNLLQSCVLNFVSPPVLLFLPAHWMKGGDKIYQLPFREKKFSNSREVKFATLSVTKTSGNLHAEKISLSIFMIAAELVYFDFWPLWEWINENQECLFLKRPGKVQVKSRPWIARFHPILWCHFIWLVSSFLAYPTLGYKLFDVFTHFPVQT